MKKSIAKIFKSFLTPQKFKKIFPRTNKKQKLIGVGLK